MNTLMDRRLSEEKTEKVVGGAPMYGYRVYLKDGSTRIFKFYHTAKKYAAENGGTIKKAIIGAI